MERRRRLRCLRAVTQVSAKLPRKLTTLPNETTDPIRKGRWIGEKGRGDGRSRTCQVRPLLGQVRRAPESIPRRVEDCRVERLFQCAAKYLARQRLPRR